MARVYRPITAEQGTASLPPYLPMYQGRDA